MNTEPGHSYRAGWPARTTAVGQVVMEPVGVTIRAPRPNDLAAFITPADEHFVVAHLGIAHLSVSTWQLHIVGAVERPFTLTYDTLRALPSRLVTATLECAGNPLRPDLPIRRVSTATWRGVPLSLLLRHAGLKAEAAYVWLQGEDFGHYAGLEVEHYVKDIPLRAALDEDVLVAYELNGAPLSAEHGFPARVLVPDYYGTSSVKWLSRITVAPCRFEGLFTTVLYNRPRPASEPVWELQVNALIVRPIHGEVLASGPQVLTGWAWSPHGVAGVEVSLDGGTTWTPAELQQPRVSHAWQRFEMGWYARHPGQYILLARATDRAGRAQPADRHLNQVHRLEVTISAIQS